MARLLDRQKRLNYMPNKVAAARIRSIVSDLQSTSISSKGTDTSQTQKITNSSAFIGNNLERLNIKPAGEVDLKEETETISPSNLKDEDKLWDWWL